VEEPRFSAIEDAVADLLEPLRASHGVRGIEVHDGELSVDLIENSGMPILPPSIFFSVSVASASKVENLDRVQWRILVYSAISNLGSIRESRRGRSELVGGYEMIEGIRENLDRKRIVEDLTIARRTDERVLGFSAKHAVFLTRSEYSCMGLY